MLQKAVQLALEDPLGGGIHLPLHSYRQIKSLRGDKGLTLWKTLQLILLGSSDA